MNRIIFHFHDFGLGGVQRKMVDLCNYIDSSEYYRKNWEPILVFRWQTEFNFQNQLNNSSLKIITAPSFFSKFGFTYAFYLAYVYLVVQPKVVVTFLHSSLRYVGFAKLLTLFLNNKIFLSQDNIFSLENRSLYSEYVFSKKSVSFWIKFVHGIIIMTNYAKVDLHKSLGVSFSKIKVIPNWLPLGVAPKNLEKKIDIVFAGRLSAQKNVFQIIKILKILSLLKKDIKCLIIGNGSYKESMQRKIKSEGLSRNIKIISANHDVLGLVEQSKCFLLPSKFEGQPLVLLEAMKLGTVPIVNNYPGVSEYFAHRHGGFIYNNAREAAAYITLVLENEDVAKKLKNDGTKFVSNYYNSDNIEQTIDYLTREKK